MKNITFPFLTNFTGRNRYFQCSGVEIFEASEREGGRVVMLSPLTSRGVPARCDILIHVASIDQLVSDLLQIKNKALDSNICPHCGSDNITAGHFDPEGCFVPVECLSCGEEWKDLYLFTGIDVPVANLIEPT